MDKSQFEVGKHYRAPEWTKEHHVTCNELGDCVKNWGYGGVHTNLIFKNYYECDEDGKAIIVAPKQTLRFQVGDMVIWDKGPDAEPLRIIKISGGYYENDKGRFSIAKQDEFSLVNVVDYSGKSVEEYYKQQKENVMKQEVKVEVKIDGKLVTNVEEYPKKVKKIKYYGQWILNGRVFNTEYFVDRKDVKAAMQDPKNLGKTLELFKRYSTLKTNIPVVEILA